MRPALRPFLALSLLLLPQALLAQEGFLFKEPKISLGLQFGAALPKASGGVFEMFNEQLTLDRNDFAAFSFGSNLAFRAAPGFDIVIDFNGSKSQSNSEFRDWVEDDGTPEGKPIVQSTSLRRTSLTAGLRYALAPRGRSVGKYAWIPLSGLKPYVGIGGGLMWYKLDQAGDFVDIETSTDESADIFNDYLVSSGSTATGHVAAGLEYWLGSHFGLTTEARYVVANASLKDAYRDFDKINLNGFNFTAGVTVRMGAK